MITIKEIATLSGVSISTVSKVLNGVDQHISEKTKLRIKKVVKENGYVSNSIARSLKIKKTNTIAFILPDINNLYYADLVRGMECEARSRQYRLIFSYTNDDIEIEQKSKKMFKSQMVDGIILCHSRLITESENKIIEDIPVVVVDRPDDFDNMSYGKIYLDDIKATYNSTMKLNQLGCKNIVCIAGKELRAQSRSNGFIDAMNDLGITVSDKNLYSGRYNFDTGVDGVKYFIEHNPGFDGIICGNDMIAIGALRELRRNKISIPKDVKIIGFDNISFSEYTVPSLTTMEQPAFDMGKAAAKMLIDSIELKIPLGKVEFFANLIYRETT